LELKMTPLTEVFRDLAEAAPDAPAITHEGVTATRAELQRRTNRLARAYEALGVREGSMVTIALPNGIEFFEACLAAWKLGATPQPVSSRSPRLELEQIVDLADPALVVGADIPGRPWGPIDFEPAISAAAGTLSGSIAAPSTTSFPRGRSPPNAAAIASELVTVERIRSTPPSR